MNLETATSTPGQARRRRGPLLLLAVLALVAGGMYAWSSLLRSARYEIEIAPAQLFSGARDTARISAFGVNRWGGRVPCSRPAISATIIEGQECGRIAEAGEEGILLFISEGMREGTVLLHVTVEDWPFPLLAVLKVSIPVAAGHSTHPRNDA
jgi:hypothetical protein